MEKEDKLEFTSELDLADIEEIITTIDDVLEETVISELDLEEEENG